jgi:peroxin-6
MHVESASGELGCWIDSTVTRMVQAGTERSRIPDIATYAGTGQYVIPHGNILLTNIGTADASNETAFLAAMLPQRSPYLLGHESSFGKLLALSSATLAHHAVDYDLHLSVLLKGARGTGKFTVATWVAQRLGMHILEVNIYLGPRVSLLKLINLSDELL